MGNQEKNKDRRKAINNTFKTLSNQGFLIYL